LAERVNEKITPKPGAVAEPGAVADPTHSVATRDEENDCDREKHRYHIALLLLGGLIAILLIPVFYKNYDNATDLAAIFSGWITSVVGFYFLQQNTEKAQQQTTIAAKDAAEARKDVVSAAKTATALVDVNEVTSFEWKKKFEEANQSRAIYEDLYEEAQTMIKELFQELDGDAGGDD